MRSRKQFAIPSIMQLLVTASFIAAQTSSSSLQGTVTDPSGSAPSAVPASCFPVTSRSWNGLMFRSIRVWVNGPLHFALLPRMACTLVI